MVDESETAVISHPVATVDKADNRNAHPIVHMTLAALNKCEGAADGEPCLPSSCLPRRASPLDDIGLNLVLNWSSKSSDDDRKHRQKNRTIRAWSLPIGVTSGHYE